MITVRYPNGFSIQYNDAHAINQLNDGSTEIIQIVDKGTSREKKWKIAQLLPGSGAIVEWVTSCRTYNAEAVDDDKLIDIVIERIRKFPAWKLRDLKTELHAFHAKSGTWR